jgi:transcription antitermination factor NusG
LPGKGTPATFAVPRQLSQQEISAILATVQGARFPREMNIVPNQKSHSCGSQGEAMPEQQTQINDIIHHRKPIAPGPEWYPLQTRYQCERKVDVGLRKEGFESFAPTRIEARRWSDRTKLVEAPLFPGYTFVRMEAAPELLIKVLRLPGLVRFVTRGSDLVAVPSEEMEVVRALAASNIEYEPGPFPAVGEKVRIRGGCLEGVEGVLTSQSEHREVVISVGAIQRSLKVQLGNYQIERLS